MIFIPFYRNKRLCKTIQYGGLPCSVKLLQLFARNRIFMKGRPNFPLLHHLFANSVKDFVRFFEG